MRIWTAIGIAACLAADWGMLLPGQALIGKRLVQEALPDKAAIQVADLAVMKAEEFRMVPVRVHLLRSPDAPAAGCKLTKEDVTRIFHKVNGIWHAAGVHLWVESVVIETPENVQGHEKEATLAINALLPLRPTATKLETAFNVYYIGSMAPNGIFMMRDGIFVKESALLHPVPGGIDEPLPRVTAHELGHGMGLPHRQDTTNLMASGTTGTSLNAAEIETVRNTTAHFAWVTSPEEFLKTAGELVSAIRQGEPAHSRQKSEVEKRDQTAESRLQAASRFRAILELPGKSPLKDRAAAKLKALVSL